MNEQKTPPTKTSVEMTFNVLNGVTGQKINSEPLTEEGARTLVIKLQESDAGAPLLIRSNRTFLME
jgi:hypothetical protein